MECAICLQSIDPSTKIFKTSCNHSYHWKCFRKYAFKTNGSFFVTCPLCRSLNTNHPSFKDPSDNLLALLENPNRRCCHTTHQGKVCKRKALPFNYGCCRQHHTKILPPHKYELFYDYLIYLIDATNEWRTKIFMSDVVKQLIINHNEIKNLNDIHHRCLEYFHHYKNRNREIGSDSNVMSQNDMYDYLKLENPPKDWIQKSLKDRIFI